MSEADSELARLLAAALSAGGPGSVRNLRRLSGGANQETWSFDLVDGGEQRGCVLRRVPTSVVARAPAAPGFGGLSLRAEAEVLRRAAAGGVPVPRVLSVLDEAAGLGEGYVMSRIEGETIPRRILRDAGFEGARQRLARQCGETLAGIHRLCVDGLPLASSDAIAQLAGYRSAYEVCDEAHPVFELAFAHLESLAAPPPAETLVHGDFRNGNLIVGPEGLRAVLDWELAHRGDPMEDLGWICVNSWRFGRIDHPVGGFGSRSELFEAYRSGGGGEVDVERVRFWELFGTLKWGIMCMGMKHRYLLGADPSMERAVIGRRASEAELDLLDLLEGR